MKAKQGNVSIVISGLHDYIANRALDLARQCSNRDSHRFRL